MNWSNLHIHCPHIIEKIIEFAAENECYKNLCCNNGSLRDCCYKALCGEIDEESSWMMKLHKYGKVCRGWKKVIFHSKILFHEDENTNERWYDDYAYDKRAMHITLKQAYENNPKFYFPRNA